MAESKIVPLIFDTYLTVIKNSLGSNMFRNLFAEVNGVKKDITEDGNLSCAFYVSSVLFIFKLIKEVHATVDGTIEDMKESGWIEVKEPKTGCVLVWEKVDFGEGNFHKHIGFYMGNGRAVSNDFEQGYPTEHPLEFNGKRKIEHIFWHQRL